MTQLTEQPKSRMQLETCRFATPDLIFPRPGLFAYARQTARRPTWAYLPWNMAVMVEKVTDRGT